MFNNNKNESYQKTINNNSKGFILMINKTNVIKIKHKF